MGFNITAGDNMLMVRELTRDEIMEIIASSNLGYEPCHNDIADVVQKCFEAARVQQTQTSAR